MMAKILCHDRRRGERKGVKGELKKATRKHNSQGEVLAKRFVEHFLNDFTECFNKTGLYERSPGVLSEERRVEEVRYEIIINAEKTD